MMSMSFSIAPQYTKKCTAGASKDSPTLRPEMRVEGLRGGVIFWYLFINERSEFFRGLSEKGLSMSGRAGPARPMPTLFRGLYHTYICDCTISDFHFIRALVYSSYLEHIWIWLIFVVTLPGSACRVKGVKIGR